MTQPPAQDPANLRASDQDRERVAEILRDAAAVGRLNMFELDERLDAVYAAKTYAELEPVTRDLPRAGTPRPAASVPAVAANPDRFGGNPSSSTAVAIMSGFSRKGTWVVPPTFTAVAIMGGIEIVVPDDAEVQVAGIGLMGGFDHAATGVGQADGPVIRVTGLAFWGGVEVKRRPPRAAGKRGKLEAKKQRLESKLEGKIQELKSRLDE
jgi:hypothetical protein